MPGEATIKEEEAPPAWPDGAVVVKTEVKAEPSLKQEPPAMPDDATVAEEEAWPAGEKVEEEESSGLGVKRRRLE